jgi:hypothetical protein
MDSQTDRNVVDGRHSQYIAPPFRLSLDNEHDVWIAVTKWRLGSCFFAVGFCSTALRAFSSRGFISSNVNC